jgi:hypothetical protein
MLPAQLLVICTLLSPQVKIKNKQFWYLNCKANTEPHRGHCRACVFNP